MARPTEYDNLVKIGQLKDADSSSDSIAQFVQMAQVAQPGDVSQADPACYESGRGRDGNSIGQDAPRSAGNEEAACAAVSAMKNPSIQKAKLSVSVPGLLGPLLPEDFARQEIACPCLNFAALGNISH